ncbi:hypothetical protein MHK_006979 [Candidatus Magnetomorum sp. HK-1]|nr:hypothetical protein MHK_006979 [Candidatus Magnetomorum sp. HK-1]
MKALKNLTNLIGKSLDEVEKTHKSISDIPFKALEKIDSIKSEVNIVKNIHDKIVDGTYDTIRKVNDGTEVIEEKSSEKES